MMDELRGLDRWPGYAEQSWQERFAELDRRYSGLNRKLTDAAYMQAAIVPMLGPKAAEVWQLWRRKGTLRLHVSWGPEGERTRGEERAQLHLDIEKACETAQLLTDEELAAL